jgi:autotransporter-associated beta strand protein
MKHGKMTQWVTGIMKRTALIVAAVVTGGISATLGATNYWDNNGIASGFGTAGGTWGTEGKWSGDSTGVAVSVITNTTTSDDLVFVGLAAGTVTVDGTNQAFRSMTFGSAFGAITLSNGTLNLATPTSEIIVNNASSNIIASTLAGASGVNLFRTLNYTSFLTTTSVTLFPNATLSDCTGIVATMAGQNIDNQPQQGTPCFFTNNGTTATVQMQIYNGGYTKCVKIELTQSGNNIAGRAVYAKYASNGGNTGYNFDIGGNNNTVATNTTSSAYGISQLNLVFPSRVLTLAGVNTYSGGTTINNNGVLQIGGMGLLGSGAYSGVITNLGQFVYNSTATQQLSGVISGTGSLVKDGPAKLTLTGVNTYTGGTVVNNGTLVLKAGAFDVGIVRGTATVNNGGTLELRGDGSGGGWPTCKTDTLNVNGGGVVNAVSSYESYVGTLNLSSANGNAATVTGESGRSIRFGNNSNGMITSTGSVANVFDVKIQLVNTSGNTLTIKAAAGNTLNITKEIFENFQYLRGPVTFSGAGSVVLSATNTYIGATTISNGTVVLSSSGMIIASTNITLAAGSLLDVTAKPTYTLAATNTYTFGINTAGTGSAGRISATGLDISTAKVVLNLTGTPDDEAYILATYTTPLTGTSFASVTGIPRGYSISYSDNGGKQIALKKNKGTLIRIF